MRVNAYEREFRDLIRQGIRCYLDGVDISNDCFEADDSEGYALCYLHDGGGRLVRRGNEAAWERRNGEVRFALITPLDMDDAT